MIIVLYIIYTLAYLLVFSWGVTIFRRTHRVGTFLFLLVLGGLIYDNLIISLGTWLGAGSTLLMLSWPRFVLHQLVLPWIVVGAFEQVQLAGHPWAQHRAARPAVWLLAGMIMIVGVLTRLVGLELEPALIDGVTRYVAVNVSGPPLVSIFSIGFVGVMGWMLWRRNQWPWVFLVVVGVFLVEGLPIQGMRFLLGSGLELVLMVVLFLTDRWLLVQRSTGLQGEEMKDEI